MRYPLYNLGDGTLKPILTAVLPTGGTATIAVYDLSNGSSVTLTSASCSEIGSTGIWYWASSNITTYPTTMKQYAYQMTHSTTGVKSSPGKIVLGGYTDNVDVQSSLIKTQTDKFGFDGSNYVSARVKATDNIALSAQQKLDVNTETDTALTDYDPPTNTEMVARTIPSANYALEATLNNATYGLSALQTLIDAIDTSTELQNRFTEIKGAGWTNETLKAIKDLVAIQGVKIDLIHQVEKGKWVRAGSQIIMYDSDGVTPLLTFNIYDENGVLCTNIANVFKRVPV